MSANSPDAISNRLEAFVREQFQVSPNDRLFGREINLYEEGYVDSAGVVEVIAFIEDTFDLEIPDAVLFDPTFTTIAGMGQQLSKLLTASSSRVSPIEVNAEEHA